MKSLEESVLEVLITFNKVYTPCKSIEAIVELVPLWVAVLEDDEELSPERIQRAAMQVLRTRAEYWPTPAVLVDALRASAPKYCLREHLPARVLPPPDAPTITPERRQAILDSIRPGARSLLEAIVGKDERSALTIHRGLRSARSLGIDKQAACAAEGAL